MNRLTNAILNADDKSVARFIGEAGIERHLLEPWGDDGETALPLAHRLATTPGDKKSRAAFERIVASLKQAFLTIPVERVPLPEAVLSGRVDVVERHLTTNPPTQANRTNDQTAMAYAVSIGDVTSTLKFLEAGVDVETRLGGKSLLMIAAEMDWEPVVELLLQHKADPNARMTVQPGLQGPTALLLAAEGKSNLKIIKMLIAAGADPNLVDAFGRTARESTRSKKVQAYLDTIAQTASHTNLPDAILADSVTSVRRLLSEGADATAADSQGITPIMHALQVGNPVVISLLLEAGASLDFPDIWSSALKERKGKDIPALVSQLSALGADIHRRNSHGLPPLFINGDPAVLQSLLKAGANPHAVLTQPTTWQDIKFKAIHLSASLEKPPPVSKNETTEEILQSLTSSMDALFQKQMVVAEFLKDKSEAFFENPEQNRTPENASYFTLYERAKAAAQANVQKLTAHDHHKMFGNRKACQFLREYLGATKDAYDYALEELKAAGKGTSAEFQAEVERVSRILNAKPQPWKKRKGVIHFVAALHKTLPGYFQAEAASDQLSKDDAEFGFERLLLARLQAEVRSHGFTLVWTEKRWNNRPVTRLLLIPSSNDLTALVACGTNRNGEESRVVVTWCDTLRRTHPFHILGASYDHMELGFQQPIPRPTDLARDIAGFCPEFAVSPTDDQAIAEFARELESTGHCFFWWD